MASQRDLPYSGKFSQVQIFAKMPLVFIFTSARIIDHAPSCRDRLAWSTVDRADRVSFSVVAMVRGYHTYKDIWAAVLGEELPCWREVGNRVDTFAEAIIAISAL